ncbi:PAAR domain-containing protein [Testudinibacter sp. TR-2022]|uniref:PAAR domain-containing protein n=1 Tax=Testudinibacter sp. TR-2022 TaxID=2585029 RepID=UPI001118E180|nr:PAAR domain-containing protein [Testudinibacter sp. TR-2022]TNH04333.1 hypothetical protein FHQ30_12100 [Pasteurellaceae bacterium Phil11]TNH23094.1 hypothetical protein FHQ29_06225 [Testudinibacter sp. TR-2022]TNH25028.1 hypothetical protein FHQ27_09660 [Testudinibacter sp. TR-2022]
MLTHGEQLAADAVQRITARINSFPRSQVRLVGAREVVEPAARQTDTIKHRSFWAALAGAVAGALVSAAVLGAATFLLGGFGGFVVGMGILLNPAVSSGIDTVKSKVESFFTPPDPDGTIILGSPNVFANNLPLAYAAMDNSDVTIACKDHSPPTMIAEGSETVFVNGLPVARKGDRTTCDAKINSGSANVFIGSGKAQYAEIAEAFSLFERILLIGVEFVIPPTAIFGKGIAKALKNSYNVVSTRGAKVGASITHKIKTQLKYKRIINRKSAEKSADIALSNGKLRGAAAELKVNGRTYTDISGSNTPMHPSMQTALDNVPIKERAPWHGYCAEIGCMNQALYAGQSLKGARGRAVNIGTSGKGHNTPKKPCSTCSNVATQLGVLLK